MVPLTKKNDVKHCKDYDTVSLISHAEKAMTRILLGRISGKIESALDTSILVVGKEEHLEMP